MAVVVGGHENGLLDTSLALLNRRDQTGSGIPGHGEQLYVNISNGNLVIQQQDAFLPSLGDDYQLLRTYNVRGCASDEHQHDDAGWSLSTSIRLDVRNDGKGERYFEVEYGDGSLFDYHLDAATGLYVSTDGAGAFETVEDLQTKGNVEPSFLLTRADQTRFSFDRLGRLIKLEDSNGVSVDYLYAADRLVQVLDDQGHVLNYVYQNGKLFQVVDEREGVLVEYRYDRGRLSEVIDRSGHSTRYFYTSDGALERIVLPAEQIVDGVLERYGNRELNFVYDAVNWGDGTRAGSKVVTQIRDAQGQVTTFEYDFRFSQGADNTGGTTGNTNVDKFLIGGTTKVIDALGNSRAYSNEAEYVDWRLSRGYYQSYDAGLAGSDPGFQAQVDAILNDHALNYSYRDDGYITEVVDQQGFHTVYVYDEKANLIAVTDRNGWGALHSDSEFYRGQRAELGVIDGAGNGKIVADLSSAEEDLLREAFTSHFEYDERGNLTRSIDNADNETTFTYTGFNKMASSTSAMGHALVSSDEQLYRDKRVELGYAALLTDLRADDISALLELYTTSLSYDANQNLIERRDPGGDITRFEYDSFGNRTQRVVFLDATDLSDPARQQVTTYAYDGFGNQVSSTDAEGYQTFSDFDHFGNLLRFTDANGGVTRFTYDADNRLLTVSDPEGHTTVNSYDAVGNRISITDAGGHTVTRIYDLNNNLIATLDPSETDPADDRITRFEYDVVGNRTAIVDAEGRRTEYRFNARRELVEVLTAEVEDETGSHTRYSSTIAYDGVGNRIRTTDNRGFTTEILYTRNNLIRQQADPGGHITRIEYDANANQVQIIAGMQLPVAKRQIQQFSYDEENQLTTRTDAEGNVTRYAYDAPGNRIATVDANGHVTEYEYDGNNRLVREIRPEVIDPKTGLPVRYTVEHRYDGNGNEIETVDENGHATRFTFDRDDQLVMVEDANGIRTVFEYDSRHNRTAVLIGVGATEEADGHIIVGDVDQAQTTRFIYDEFNQLTAQVDGVGNALAESDGALYQRLRQELGYPVQADNLSAAERQALRALYTRHFAYDKVGNQISRVDNLGRATSFAYDALNRLSSTTDALGKVAGFRYDGNGNKVAQTDAEGRVTRFSYDGADRLTETVDPLGTATRRDYDDFGNMVEETRAFGTGEARTSRFEYDLNNRIAASTDPEGHTQSFQYDAVGNRIRVTDGRGSETHYLYDALNRNIKIIDPLSFETRMEYDGIGNRISLIDARGGISRFEYDPGDRRIRTVDAEGRVTTFAYDVRGNRIEQRTASGTVDEELTLFEYDAENNLRRVIDAEGGITENGYDRVHNRIVVTDANGHTTGTEFDALNRVFRVVDAEGQVTDFAYDAVGNRLSRTDSLGRVTRFVYDDNDRLIRQIAADGVETHFAYDAVGNRASITRAANTSDAATDFFVYDLDDRLVAQTDAEGFTTRYDYDANHNRTVVTDANGHATLYTYDENDRVVSIEDAEGNVVRYAYDGNGNRTQVIDANGHVSTSYYNANDEVVLSVDAEGYATRFVYDNNGNLVSRTLHMKALALPVDPSTAPTPVSDSADQTTRFVYDKLNRTVARIDAEGYATRFVYDKVGNVLSQTLHMQPLALPPAEGALDAIPGSAADQTTRFEYDKVDRKTVRIDAEGYRTEYAYDAVGNRVETRLYRDLDGTDIAVSRTYYDKANREVSSVTAEGYLTVFGFDGRGNRTSRTVYDERVAIPESGVPAPSPGDGGRTHTMAYDAVNRLVREISPHGVHTDFEYDGVGNRTAVIEAAGSADERRTTFAYDDADRLTETTDALGIVARLTLDGAGNVVERRDALGSAEERLSTFTYDGNNLLTGRTDPLGVVTESVYDAAGNLVRRTSAAGLPEVRTETMEYDRNNRLTGQVNGEGERTESTYDGAGNRIRLTLAPGLPEERVNTFEFDRDNRLVAGNDGEGVRTEYRYDGAGNKVETIQAAGLTGQERHSFYLYDLDNRLTQVTDPMGGVTRYTYDVLGNQTRIVNANGGVQTNTFDALGRLLSSLSAGDVLTVNAYDLRGNIVRTTQSFGDGSDFRTTTYGYDLLERQVRVTGPEGFSTVIDYDPFGNQTLVTHGQYLPQPGAADYDAALDSRSFAQTNAFAYDRADRLLSMTDGEGNIVIYGYDAVGNRTSMTEAAGSEPRTTVYSYDRAGRLVETVTPEGGISRNSYDETGNRVAETILQSDDGATRVWIERRFEYDGNARLTAEIDPYGVRTEYIYDAMGNRTLERHAAGTADQRITRKEYDLNNRVSVQIDGEGNRSRFSYDSLGNRIKATDALGRVARYYFDGSNNLVAILDAEGYVNAFSYDSAGNRIAEAVYMTRYSGPVDDFAAPAPTAAADDRMFRSEYDGNGRITSRREADGARTLFEYDAAGNLRREVRFANTDAPRELLYGYDLNNRLVHFTDVDGTVTTFSWDGANNKTSESIASATDPHAVRRTAFEYDLNNRLVRETFDPDGLNLRQDKEYDRVGNVIAKTDANGHVTGFEYDRNNRLVRQVDALGNDTLIAYDGVGNKIAITDANGQTTDLVYDGNNRMVREIAPQVQVYTIDVGFLPVRPTITHVYDGAGNEVQTIDAAGFTTTRYFDSNDRKVAEINGDNALREWTYNAAGEQTGETLHMTRLAAAAHDPAARPAAPAGESRTLVREYDLAGRVTRLVYPEVEVTTLAGVDTERPSATAGTVRPEERFAYDPFGNQVEAFDRNGNRSVAWYDAKGRMSASIDAEGYLTEFDYDAQDNVLEQRVYTERLDMASLNPANRPAPPAGEVYQINRVYDAASRLVEERSPLVPVFDPATLSASDERVITRYTYDGAGNQLSRTLAAHSPQESTEYSYYDAMGRQVAVIDGNRVVNLIGYDAAGNQTLARRFFNPVDGSIDLNTLDGALTDFNSLVGGNRDDQTIRRLYDALGRLSSETELMGAGSADDLIQRFGYDANGNRVHAEDEDGFEQSFAYNALGALMKSVGPDGSGTVYEYDAAGNQIFAFTGQLDGVPAPASNIEAFLGDHLVVNWTLPGAGGQSYVVYDSVSRDEIHAYAGQSPVRGAHPDGTGSVRIPDGTVSADGRLYFRVVTKDIAGSLTWSSEQVVTLPPRLIDVDVEQTAPGTLEVTAEFESGAASPQLLFGMPGATNTAVALAEQGSGVYKAVLKGVSSPQELAYRILWQDSAGTTYGGGEVPFEARGEHAGIRSTLSESTVLDGGETLYKAHIDSTVPTGVADGLLTLAATWERTDVEDGPTGSASVKGVDSGLGFSSYALMLGADTPLDAGVYTVSLIGVGETDDLILDTFEITLGSGILTGAEHSVSWNAPAAGDDQLVIVDGAPVKAGREDGRVVVDPEFAGPGAVDYSAFYGTAAVDSHTTIVTSTEVTETESHTDTSTNPPTITETVTVLGYDLGISITLSEAEAASVGGEIRLAWRPAGSGDAFVDEMPLAAEGATFSAVLPQLEGGRYDLKAYYLDEGGSEVIVDWLRADTAAETVTSGRSLTVQARETDGTITLSADEVLSIDPGLFSGPVGAVLGDLSLETVETGLAGGSLKTDGSQAGYFTESRFNALNVRIATNAETGLWREFGVDANGNVVATRNFGVDTESEAIATFTAFDGRNREIARFGAAVAVHGETEESRAVTRLEYDAQDRVIRETDARGAVVERTWNALGSQLTEKNQLGDVTTYRYDRLGRRTAEVDALGNTRYMFYDTAGNLVQEIDGEGHATSYTYDVFGRRIQVTNALGQSVQLEYDHRDRLIQATDALGVATTYAYDGRDHRMASITQGPDGSGNYNLLKALNLIEKEIRAIPVTQYAVFDGETMLWLPIEGSGGVPMTDGEMGSGWGIPTDDGEGGTYYQYHAMRTVARYTGSQMDVVRQRAVDLEIDYDYWNENLLSRPAELVTLMEAMGYRAQLETAALSGHVIRQEWDGMGRVVDTVTYQDGQELHETSRYDAYGNMIASADAEGRITTRVFGEFGRQLQEIDPAGRITFYEYDDQGNIQREWNPSTGKDIRRSYDAAGRLIEVDDLGTGVKTVYTYDADGRRMSELTTAPGHEHDRHIIYEYDAAGQMVRWADAVTGMHTNYQWDAAGNLHRAYTDTGYDPQAETIDMAGVLGQVLEELRSIEEPKYQVSDGETDYWLPTEGSDGEIAYTDKYGRTYWRVTYADGEGGTYTQDHLMGSGPKYSGSPNEIIRQRALDLGLNLEPYDRAFQLYRYDDGEGGVEEYWRGDLLKSRPALGDLLEEMGFGEKLEAATDPEFRFLDHEYAYDKNNRLTQLKQNGVVETEYGYDKAGNRIQANAEGTLTDYTFDDSGRVIEARVGGELTAAWQYDAVGNVIKFATYKGGKEDQVTVRQYYENSRTYYTESGGQKTTLTMDKSGRILRTTLVADGQTNTYTHVYDEAGREVRIDGRGKRKKGTTVNTFDTNDKLIESNKGRGDKMARAEVQRFVYNNEGQILSRFQDTGKGSMASAITETEYAYAGGNPVGETAASAEKSTTLLDTGTYNLVQPMGEDFPGSAVSSFTTREGDTLQSIAAVVYGNPSLWYVLAEANNLDPATRLTEGQRLEVPNTVKSGRLTADTHKVYEESEIIGSSLPNLKTSKKKGCSSFLAIIIVVVISVVAFYVVGPLAGAIAKGVFGAASLAEAAVGVQIASWAVAGAVVGAAASSVQQGLFIALGYQDRFSWKSVAAGAVSGALAGAARGVASLNLAQLERAFGAVEHAKVAAAALKIAGAASKQVIENGKITSYSSLAVAALSPTRGNPNASKLVEIGGKLIQVPTESLAGLGTLSSDTIDYLSPWLEAAETYAREGNLESADWATAIGGTLRSAFSNSDSPQLLQHDGSSALGQTLNSMVENSFKNLMVGGALSAFNKDAAQSFIENSVGNEVGQFIGGGVVRATGLDRIDENQNGVTARDTQVDQGKEEVIELIANTSGISREEAAKELEAWNSSAMTYDKDKGMYLDAEGKPIPLLASLDGQEELERKVLLKGYTGPLPDSISTTGGVYDQQNSDLGLDNRAKLVLEARLLDPEKFQERMGKLTEAVLSMDIEEQAKALAYAEEVLAAHIKLAHGDDDYAKLILAERRMQFADDVYENDPTGGLLFGHRLSRQEIIDRNLDPDDFNDRKSGYFSALYKDEITAEYVLANRGTEMNRGLREAVKDWSANIMQALGIESPQYKVATDLANRVTISTGGNVVFTGHSLGGGLASAQALRTNLKAMTFNAAGLSSDTAQRHELDRSKSKELIDTFYIKGDILSTVQDSTVLDVALFGFGTLLQNTLATQDVIGDIITINKPDFSGFGFFTLPEASGRQVKLPPVANGRIIDRSDKGAPSMLDLHGAGYLLDSLRYMKENH